MEYPEVPCQASEMGFSRGAKSSDYKGLGRDNTGGNTSTHHGKRPIDAIYWQKQVTSPLGQDCGEFDVYKE